MKITIDDFEIPDTDDVWEFVKNTNLGRILEQMTEEQNYYIERIFNSFCLESARIKSYWADYAKKEME